LVLSRHRADLGGAAVERLLPAIARLFGGRSVEAVLGALDAEAAGGSARDFAREAAAAIRQKSPTSLKIAFEQMRLGGALDFRAAMRMEFRIASHIVRGHDLYEGIRAVVVDKDNRPRWRPASLAEVTEEAVRAHFASAASAARTPA
jgi:enoyl-CoA hydratase